MKLLDLMQRLWQDDGGVGDPHTPQRFPRGPQQPWWLILTPLWIPVAVIIAFILIVTLFLR
jgi:hypothetical protein